MVPHPWMMKGQQTVCFSDCLNINFEDRPRLNDLGEIPEGSIPKKFIWMESMAPVGYVEPDDGEGDDEEEDDE